VLVELLAEFYIQDDRPKVDFAAVGEKRRAAEMLPLP
jgi:hypothetical protein